MWYKKLPNYWFIQVLYPAQTLSLFDRKLPLSRNLSGLPLLVQFIVWASLKRTAFHINVVLMSCKCSCMEYRKK
jgi:hypothetical protein